MPAAIESWPEIVTATELADYLKVSRATVWKWVRKGRIPVIRLNSRLFRFDLDKVLAAISVPALQNRTLAD